MRPVDQTRSADPLSRCALALIDVQNDFCAESGAVAHMGQDTGSIRAAMPRIEALCAAARTAGRPVIFVRTTHGEWTDTPAWLRRGAAGEELDVGSCPTVLSGTWGAEFFQVVPDASDLVVTKHRYSAFQYTALELALRAKQVDTLMLAGTQTDVCVYATALDALMRGFATVLVEDCCASGSDARHAAGVRQFRDVAGSVVRLGEVLRGWGIQP